MPGDSPGQAVRAFLEPIKTAISCLCDARVQYASNPAVSSPQAAVLNWGEPVRLHSLFGAYPSLHLEITLHYSVREDEGSRGPYRCTSTGYIMELSDQNGRELIGYHWHPISASPVTTPHFHVGEGHLKQADRLHVPTKRFTVEEFVETAIRSFGAEPTVDEAIWRECLAESRALHEEHRTWHEHGESPTL